jgi:hypothetical protein
MKPIVVLSNVTHQCVTFVWPDDLRYYVGYRFLEHQPIRTPGPLAHGETSLTPPPQAGTPMPRRQEWLDNWQTTYAAPDNPLQLRFQTFTDGSAVASMVENEGAQARTVHFVPEENGVRLWMTLTTQEAIPGSYIVPQCLRLSGDIGSGFRRTVACVPFLSELLMQALGNANGTITWARQNGVWRPFPVPFTRYHTAAGEGVYEDSSGQIDCGLIARESASRDQAPPSYWQAVAPDATWEQWSAGLYWERATSVSNRHPADCVHVTVDFGPLAAGESRTVQGKVYWLAGSKEELFAVWRREFG